MTDFPIIFSAPMVRALIDGHKIMTRRMAWGNPMPGLYESDGGPLAPILRPTIWQKVRPGDRLYVKETSCPCVCSSTPGPMKDARYVVFKGGGQMYRDGTQYPPVKNPAPGSDSLTKGRWVSARFMPRWASRLTLRVTATKIERVQDITSDEAFLEGFPSRAAFAGYWSHELRRKRAWIDNPEVVALTFSVEKLNIDRIAA